MFTGNWSHWSLRSSFWSAVLCLVVAAGCGGPQPEIVNPELARQTLESTLDRWKQGDLPETLATENPEVIVQDMDWTNGAKLIEFALVDDGESVDANLRAKVKLSLQDASGKTSERTVTYVVTTSPKLTVFRDMLN